MDAYDKAAAALFDVAIVGRVSRRLFGGLRLDDRSGVDC
jgi:hypothetical protein